MMDRLMAVLSLRMPRPRRSRTRGKQRQRVAVAAVEAAAAVVLAAAAGAPAAAAGVPAATGVAAATVAAGAGRRAWGLHSLRNGQSGRIGGRASPHGVEADQRVYGSSRARGAARWFRIGVRWGPRCDEFF